MGQTTCCHNDTRNKSNDLDFVSQKEICERTTILAAKHGKEERKSETSKILEDKLEIWELDSEFIIPQEIITEYEKGPELVILLKGVLGKRSYSRYSGFFC